ncbi:MAG: dihydrofolate reductase family protein [Rudaea sp.]
MRKIIEYTLLSADGVFENPASWGAMSYRDDGYLRDGLGLLRSCDAMLIGRVTYESLAKIWPSRTDPWATRLNEMKKYVFSSKLDKVEWNNSTLIRGDVVAAVTQLKQESGASLLIWGHGMLGATLLDHGLTDFLDLSVHPVIVGNGRRFFREGKSAKLKLVGTKSFSKIVKLSYEPQH